jgi:hypothetical protein
MSLKGILRRMMYHDRADVYRLRQVQAPDGSDDYAEEETPVYERLPCKLSQYGKDPTTDKTERAVSVFIDLRLCCDPAFDIRANDRVVVLRQGKRMEFVAGISFPYQTHQEIALRRRGEVGNGR